MHGPTAVRKRRTATCTPATAPTNSAKFGANPATGEEGLYICLVVCRDLAIMWALLWA